MAEDKRRKKKTGRRTRAGRAPDGVTVRRVPGGKTFELVHPPCAQERAEDMEEVHAMLEAGELEIAEDELRWLVGGCNALLEGHQLLGRLAMQRGELPLARGHLGYAFDLGLRALPKGGLSGTLPSARPANRPFFEAGKALAECLQSLGKPEMAADVAGKLLKLDPADPLDVKGILEEGPR